MHPMRDVLLKQEVYKPERIYKGMEQQCWRVLWDTQGNIFETYLSN